MSSPPTKRTLALEDFVGFLAALAERGLEVVVIGGCAVGAYARMIGQETLSADLDLYCTRETLNAVIEWGDRQGLALEKRPQPRSVPVAVLYWQTLEVNILTASEGLPPPSEVARLARLLRLTQHGGVPVLLADPFDLIANKTRVDRPKDRAHLEILRQFVEEEIVHAFREAEDPRERLAPARRLLEATRARCLPEALATRLIMHVRTDADLRFLMNCVPTAALADAVLSHASGRPDLDSELVRIRRHRRLR